MLTLNFFSDCNRVFYFPVNLDSFNISGNVCVYDKYSLHINGNVCAMDIWGSHISATYVAFCRSETIDPGKVSPKQYFFLMR